MQYQTAWAIPGTFLKSVLCLQVKQTLALMYWCMYVYVCQILSWLPRCTQVMRGRHHGMCPSRRSDASRAFRFIPLRRWG